jgi:asparagine synthase (glutamine-hydrolysing)
VRCCTAIFPGWDNPELPLARRVAAHLGTSLEEIPVSSADVSALFAPAVSAMEEPPRHYKIFALWKLYDYAAREAPLVISGIGAENVFGPKAVKWLRVNARRAEAFRRVPLAWRRRLARMLPRSRSGRLALVRNLACCDGERDLFAFLILCDERLPHTAFARGIPDVPTPGDEFWASYIDGLPTFEDRQQVYGLLTEDKPDMQSRVRIGGAFGVNTVHPFLSIEALRVGLAQPVADRLRDGWSKPLVRELACRYFPRDWIYCEKFGFPTPLGAWMDGPLKPRVDMLEDGRDAVPGLWRPDVLAQCRQERNHEVLWGAMTLEFLLRRAQGRADDGLTPMPGRA